MLFNLSEIPTSAFVGILLIPIFIFFRNSSPYTHAPEKIEMTKKEYLLSYLFLVISFATLAVSLVFGFLFFFSIWQNSYSQTGNINLCHGEYFGIGPSILLGVSLGFFVTNYIFLKWKPKKHTEFWAMYNMSYRFKAFEIVKFLLMLFAIAGIALFYLSLNQNFIITNNEIKISKLFQFSDTSYTYIDIKEINRKSKFIAPNGKEVERDHYIISFSDGQDWNSRKESLKEGKELNQAIQIISERSQVSITIQ